MPDSSSELRSFEGVFRLLLMLFDGGMLAELSGQELKILVAVAIYQAAENRRAWKTTVTELEQLLAMSNKTVNKALDSLVERRMVKKTAAKGSRHRAAKPFWLAIDTEVTAHERWPELPWADIDRLSRTTFDRLQSEYDTTPVFEGRYVLGTRKTSE